MQKRPKTPKKNSKPNIIPEEYLAISKNDYEQSGTITVLESSNVPQSLIESDFGYSDEIWVFKLHKVLKKTWREVI